MAKEVVIKARLDTGDSVSQVEKLRKSVAAISKENPATALEQLNKTVESGNMSVSELKRAIKDYQTIALQAGQTSPIGQEALNMAGKLKDRMGDVQAQMRVMATDGKALNAAMAVSNTVVSGYTAFIGLTQLAGGENKKLLETMAKMQIVMQTLNAVEQVANSLRKGSIITTYAMNVAYKMLGIGVTGATASIGLFTKALIATGIGAIVVGLGLLIANFKEIVAWVKKVTFGYEDNTDKIKANTEALRANTSAAVKLVEDDYKRRINLQKAYGKETYELEREALLKKEQLLKRELELYVLYTKILIAKGQLNTEEARQRTQEIKEMLNNYKNVVNEMQVLDAQEQTRKRKQWEEEQKRNAEKWAQIAEERRLDAEFRKHKVEQLNTVTQVSIDTSNMLTEIDKNVAASMKERLKETTQELNDYVNAQKERIAEILLLEDTIRTSVLNTIGSLGSIFDSLAAMQERGSRQYKRLALMAIMASQAESIANAVLAATKAARDLTYDPTGVGRIAIYVSTVTSIIASVLSNINRARQLLGESGDVGGFGGAGVSAPRQGATQEQEQTTGYQNPATQGGQTVKVVVLESDITKVQNSVKYIEKVSAI